MQYKTQRTVSHNAMSFTWPSISSVIIKQHFSLDFLDKIGKMKITVYLQDDNWMISTCNMIRSCDKYVTA